jgi:hypothetical protein
MVYGFHSSGISVTPGCCAAPIAVIVTLNETLIKLNWSSHSEYDIALPCLPSDTYLLPSKRHCLI